MKKIKIASIVCAGIALILEILPIGIIIKGDSFYRESEFYSYFDLYVFRLGNIGPFFCAVLTAALFGMMLSSMFFKAHKAYTLFVCALAFSTVVLSLTPTLFGQYSLYGLIVTVLLSLSAEMCTMAYINREKK